MIFKVRTAGTYYNKKDMEKLKALGFEFDVEEDPPHWYSSGWDGGCYKKAGGLFHPTVELNAVDELLKFMEEYGNIIIDEDGITIYDDYVE